MSDKKKEKSPFAGALADKLKGLDIEPSERPSADDAKPRPAERPELEPPEQPSELSDEELFARALDDLDPTDLYRGKFEGKGPSFPERTQPGSPQSRATRDQAARRAADESVEQPDDDQARAEVAKAREARIFEKAVGPVDQRIPRDKYRRPSMPDPAEDAARRAAYRSESPDGLITPALPKSGDGLNNVGPLDAAQKDLLERYKKRARRHDAPEINVRGDTVDDALRQLELFVHLQWKERVRFVRIIHGRGLRSDGDPVLKPAVLRWLEGPGFRYVRGYVPEVNAGGDYGSLLVELERKGSSE